MSRTRFEIAQQKLLVNLVLVVQLIQWELSEKLLGESVNEFVTVDEIFGVF